MGWAGTGAHLARLVCELGWEGNNGSDLLSLVIWLDHELQSLLDLRQLERSAVVFVCTAPPAGSYEKEEGGPRAQGQAVAAAAGRSPKWRKSTSA